MSVWFLFRVGSWSYEIGRFNQKIDWAFVNDTVCGIKFKLFQHFDSISTGYCYGKKVYPEAIGLTCTYFLNGQLKEMIPALGYEQAVRTQFDSLGFNVLNFELHKMNSAANEISVVKVKIQRMES